MTAVRPEGLSGHETGRVGFHLKNAARWSKIGDRRNAKGGTYPRNRWICDRCRAIMAVVRSDMSINAEGNRNDREL